MKLSEFKYQKSGETEASSRRVIVLSEDEDHLAGIDLSKLSKEEQDALLTTFFAFQDKVSGVMVKAFRNFKKNLIRD